ncbi:DUF4435 domain-containing protein [Pseudomonas extremaustralis]|uniref:DUF4435 domain-containing protein n=1 Tax=Pseudomonas extremaustralis TaxID=359110 RepID=UPI0023DE7069|nr:DUF4435 domain-containing protein [Pseudomonas extremaustralis]MDF3135351.1 DUF4435 domain-containing protein [Pseudomonas extremaustralis]
MSALEYSNDALNALDAFMECDHILFVEGDDDVLFWRTVFEKCSDLTVDIRPVGGVNELQPYVNKVKCGDLSCLVAQDSDYTRYVPGFVRHPRVLYTFGYSIENTIYKSDLISSVIGLWSKRNINCLKDVDEWLERFSRVVGPLFYLDFVNYKKGLEVDVGAGHCQKFMASRTSEEIDYLILQQHLEMLHLEHGIVCSDEEYELIKNVPVILLMRGHFLQSAVLRFVNKKIKEFGRKASVSVDALYAHALHYFQNGFSWKSVEGRYYARQIRNIS